jgi:hypothetical protein
MIYALILITLALLVAQRFISSRELEAARTHAASREDALLDQTRHLADQIVLLKVAPEMAAIQAVPAEEANASSPYISASDDFATAEYELARQGLERSTAELIELHAGASE